MHRPQTLAEVARIVRASPADYAMPLDEFCDEFYLDHPDKAAQQRRIDPVPEPIGDALADAWIGSVGEHLALRWGLRVPAWTPARRTSRWMSRISRPPPKLCAASSLSRAHRRSARG